MPLRINPIKVKQSIYFRVPNDIVDLIGVDTHSDVTLTLDETNDEHLLVYRVMKNKNLTESSLPQLEKTVALGRYPQGR